MKHQDGMTMLEVLIATAIFGFAIVAVAGYYPAASRGVRIGRATTVAAFLAHEKLDEITNKGFTYSPSTSPETIVLDGLTYTRTVTVSGPPYESSALLKRVDVKVSWTDGGVSKSVTMMTLILDTS